MVAALTWKEYAREGVTITELCGALTPLEMTATVVAIGASEVMVWMASYNVTSTSTVE